MRADVGASVGRTRGRAGDGFRLHAGEGSAIWLLAMVAAWLLMAAGARAAVSTSISGTVYGGSGTSTPVANLCVEVYEASDESDLVGSAETASDGTYAVDHLTPGTGYLVEFDPSCDGKASSYAIQWYEDAASDAGATTVVPTSINPSSGINANLQVGGSISGQITDAGGDPITTQDICVQATIDGDYVGSATTDASGDYTITLASGSYDVEASDCPGSSRDDAPTYYGAPTAVSVTAGQASSGINIQMNPGTSISGTVYGGSGTSTPVADVCVEVYEASDQYDVVGSAETAPDATYTVDHLTPGTGYLVEFEPSCDGETSSQYLAQWYDDAASAASATNVTPTVASPSTAINANLVVGGSISGQVTDAGGDPITTQDICVAASSTTGDYYGSARTDASGDYTIIGLASGSYDVEASDCSGSTRDDLPTTMARRRPCR
ncbi:MAG: collagen binding domain-containing protein [Solirubrobacteraceae bacterium]